MATYQPVCPAEYTLAVIGGRWKILIIWQLMSGTQRFTDFQRAMPAITHKILTEQLRELERDGVVSRTVHAQVPPKVEYALTPRGLALESVIEAMCAWEQNTRQPEAAEIASAIAVAQ